MNGMYKCIHALAVYMEIQVTIYDKEDFDELRKILAELMVIQEAMK